MATSLFLTISLPFTNPIEIFAIVLVIILIAPILFRKLRIPGLIGLIIFGILIGPNVFNLLSAEIGFTIFGTIGLLYLMFLAGLEIDLHDFQRNRSKAILFGALTFGLPFIAGVCTGLWLLNTSFLASMLIGAMLASHTLVSYPIIGKYGVKNHPVVTMLIGGTIVADTLALIVLGLVSDLSTGDTTILFWVKTSLYYLLFSLFVLVAVPRISQWFFLHFEGEYTSEYIFVLVVVFASSVVAELLKIEPIIGAFFAGLALNKLIVRTSPLMSRITFSGESLFIPFFLISVGMLVNPKALVSNPDQLIISITLLVLAIASKFLAAYIFKVIQKYSRHALNILFGLSTARAASAIAIVLVGFNLNLLDESMVNITVVIILFTCIVSSFLVEHGSKHLALEELDKLTPVRRHEERILVPISNPETMEHLIQFSLLVKDAESQAPVYPLTVVPDTDTASENIKKSTQLLEKVVEHASSMERKVEILSRVDLNVTNGISRVVKEMHIDKIVVGWNKKLNTTNYFFGTLLENLLKKSNKTICVVKTPGKFSIIRRLFVMVPPNFEKEIGFQESLTLLLRLAKQLNSTVLFICDHASSIKLKVSMNDHKIKIPVEFIVRDTKDYTSHLPGNIKDSDMLVVLKARKNTVSYLRSMEGMPNILANTYDSNNLIIIYPEQESVSYMHYIFD